jgi:signal transduction histidine kinase
VAVASGAVLALVPVAEWALDTAEPGWGAWFAGISFTTVITIFARRLRLAMVELRAAQDELAERSRAEERTRIAAEVHDVIGHALTVSLLHISGARLALDEDPQEARRSLLEAERLTRDSLEEVRATVGVMRTDVPGDRAPLPGAGDLPELVESFRRAGSDVQLVVDEHLGALGATRGLAAYRIVQEALTNATRHAPGRPVVVQVGPARDGTTVTVHNDGPPVPAPTPGAGILGMRERAENLGGHLTAEPTDGGWLVEAVLPHE